MSAPQQNLIDADIELNMQSALQDQRDSFLSEGMVSAETRIDRINRAIDVLVSHSEAISKAMNEAFDTTELCVFTGGPEVGQAFSALPFDHMIFTGATSIARHIMGAAARNLVPVTLELGGKSPVVISRSADLSQAMQRIMVGKMLNAGQVCIAPDYLLVPEEKLDEVVEQATQAVNEMYPTLLNNQQYTAVINDRHYQRLISNVTDAQERAIKTVVINPANENFEETIAYINSNPRPLAAYYFGDDKIEEQRFLTHTTSGGVCINDVMFHMLQKDLPFGGIGASGMGAYHGIEGFKTFSHAKAIYRQTKKFNVAKLAGLLPPYGAVSEKNIRSQIKR